MNYSTPNNRSNQTPYTTIVNYSYSTFNLISHSSLKTWGGSNPIFAHGKMCVFPFFPMGKNGEKSIWKEREMNTFPFLSIYFFSHFSQWGKMGKHTFFHGQKWGWTPPPQDLAQ